MENFSGLTVMITGASAGIGLVFARHFHREGARVVLIARREEVLKSHVTAFNQERENSAEYLALDISTHEIEKAIQYIQAHRVDILINNAGRGSFGQFESLSITEELQMVSLNVMAGMRLTHAVIPQMKKRKSGALIAVSSVAGFQALPYMATYAATKAFNLFHAMGLRYELKAFNIRVLSVCPGPVDTEFNGVARIPGTMSGGKRDSPEQVVSESMRALRRNKAFVVPCLQAKFMWLGISLFPRALTTFYTGWTLRTTLRAAGKEK